MQQKKLRESAPPGWIKKGFYCLWCQSFWWGMATAIFFAGTGRITWADLVTYWLAFSGGGIVINQAFTRN